MKLYEDTKKELLDICLQMLKNDLVIGSAGNVSVRVGDHVVITPSSIHYDEMSSDDMIVLDMNGNVLEGNKNPSIEYKMHLELYSSREDAKAIVHTHSLYACAMAVLNVPLPPIIDETVPKLGSEIRVSKYAMPGTKDLAKYVREAMEERSAALIGNHGAVCIAKTLKEALHLAILLERICKIYMLARQIDTPIHLPEEVVEDEQDVWEMMRGY
jgi:L-fuculose-phosphate aldolase